MTKEERLTRRAPLFHRLILPIHLGSSAPQVGMSLASFSQQLYVFGLVDRGSILTAENEDLTS